MGGRYWKVARPPNVNLLIPAPFYSTRGPSAIMVTLLVLIVGYKLQTDPLVPLKKNRYPDQIDNNTAIAVIITNPVKKITLVFGRLLGLSQTSLYQCRPKAADNPVAIKVVKDTKHNSSKHSSVIVLSLFGWLIVEVLYASFIFSVICNYITP